MFINVVDFMQEKTQLTGFPSSPGSPCEIEKEKKRPLR